MRARAVAGTSALAVVAVAVWATFAPRPATDDLPPGFELARMHLGLTPLPLEPVTIPDERRGDTAIQRVALPTDDVIFYLIGTTGD